MQSEALRLAVLEVVGLAQLVEVGQLDLQAGFEGLLFEVSFFVLRLRSLAFFEGILGEVGERL